MATKDELITLIKGGGSSAGGAPPAPIYLASTHGVYALNDPKSMEYFTVPPNTYIFEASSVGEATLTSIDIPIWDMIQEREEFASYLLADAGATNSTKKQLIKHLVYYKPGDKVYKRTLILEPENQYQYNWGYYKFEPGVQGIPFPESYEQSTETPVIIPNPPGNPPLTPVMKSFRDEHFPLMRMKLRNFERVDTGSNQHFINETRRREGYEGPAIFIFSSCASFWTSDNKKLDDLKIIDIGRAQQVACQAFAEMGFESGQISGTSGIPNLLNPTLTESIALRVKQRKPMHIEFFSKLEKLKRGNAVASLDKEEETYLSRVGEENPRYKDRRFPYPHIDPGSATIFVRNGSATAGEFPYKVAQSPSGRVWWTPDEINSGLSEGLQLYVNVANNFILIQRRAGQYTAALRHDPKSTPEHHSKKGGTRKFKRKYKRIRKIKRTRKQECKIR
jgi:hypothetical protein